jgi:hypothetical protein
MHDWTVVPSGIYRDFHSEWLPQIKRVLNEGLLPEGLYAILEQAAGSYVADVLTLGETVEASDVGGGTATLVKPRPKTSHYSDSLHASRIRRIAIKHVSNDRTVAVIELVSPGNKSSKRDMDAFLKKACDCLSQGIHLLIIDPFPPGPRDPDGIHDRIWTDYTGQGFELPPEKPLTLVAYEAGPITRAYIETIAVGESLPDMPLFVASEYHIMVPLEETYQAAWNAVPERWRRVVAAT